MAYARGDGVLFFDFGTDFDHAHFGRCLVFGGVVMWKGRSGITLVSEPRCIWRKVEIPMVNPTQAILPVYIDRRREAVARVGRAEQTWVKEAALPLCRRKRWQLSLALAGWNHSPRHQVTSLARACLPTPLQVSRLRVDRRRMPPTYMHGTRSDSAWAFGDSSHGFARQPPISQTADILPSFDVMGIAKRHSTGIAIITIL